MDVKSAARIMVDHIDSQTALRDKAALDTAQAFNEVLDYELEYGPDDASNAARAKARLDVRRAFDKVSRTVNPAIDEACNVIAAANPWDAGRAMTEARVERDLLRVLKLKLRVS